MDMRPCERGGRGEERGAREPGAAAKRPKEQVTKWLDYIRNGSWGKSNPAPGWRNLGNVVGRV